MLNILVQRATGGDQLVEPALYAGGRLEDQLASCWLAAASRVQHPSCKMITTSLLISVE